jgi:CheY-like chemotaxis protein/HPt (histidine-containing phosphotransfer) domain-containing protein
VTLTVHNPSEVPPQVAGRFFEKYVTGRKSGGTGLGTSSARLMAKAQHGDLQMRTGPGGTTLTLTLPASKDAVVAPLPAPAPREDQQWLQAMPERSLLLVDDDEFTRLVTRRQLPTPPFRVETAANGQQAIDAMARHWPAYLLVDMEMPVKNGIDTVRWLREQEAAHSLPRCRVVMMSGNDAEDATGRALQAGVDRFLAKPVSRERLMQALRELETQQPAAAPATPPSAAPADAAPDAPVQVDADWQDLYPEFLRLQREAVDGMAQALAGDDRAQLNFLAHRSFGALAAMGMDWAAAQSRALEHTALQAQREELERRIGALRDYLRTVRVEFR